MGVQRLVASADLQRAEDWSNPYDAPAAADVVLWLLSTVRKMRKPSNISSSARPRSFCEPLIPVGLSLSAARGNKRMKPVLQMHFMALVPFR